MSPVEQAIWSFMQALSNACQFVGLIGLIGIGVIFINKFTDKLLEEKEK
ncbi:MAG: hypothetical protein IJ523_07175 [Succinivibrionaceae bacterium]|nr:hypothetical protein [Succinivibrionaceae bacterium]